MQRTTKPVATFMAEAVRLAEQGMRQGAGGPFGAVIVRRGRIIARGWNRVTSAHDPTAHAEIVALRTACAKRRRFKLDDCELYSSCEPCPMCLAAAYWAGIPLVFYAATRTDAAAAGFADEWLYGELALPVTERRLLMRQTGRRQALKVFRAWRALPNKVPY